MRYFILNTHKHASLMVFFIVVTFFHDSIMQADAHGFMLTPRTRNEFAAQEGVNGVPTAGLPSKEYCSHCLNTNNGVCGKSPNFDYDNYKDSEGNSMPWISQENVMEGQVITVKSYLDTHHNGHMELKACPNGNASTQSCFDLPGHELVFQEDVLYGMPADPSYPGRGYYAGGQGGELKSHEMSFKLPDGIIGDKVMLQYKYITANSCSPPGYQEYFNGANSQNKVIDSSFWTPGLGICTPPYPSDGTRGTTWPEQFFNCAEVSITESAPSPPTPPTTPSPTITKQPTPTPIQPPVDTGSGCCSWSPYLECSQPGNMWCQESVGNCEGACSGKWLVSNPPTAYPVWSPPTSPSPTKSPIVEPPTSSTGCCSINFKTCHHPEGTFCWESEENCVGPCGKYWLPNGPIDDCIAQWDPCTSDEECCAHAICAYDGVCRADSWSPPPSPPKSSSPTTPSPTTTNNPTKTAPTSTVEKITCSPDSTKSSWDALMDMIPISYTVSTTPYTLSVISSGGAAGDGSSVVSEGQAYGVLAAALTIASMKEGDINYNEAKNKFEGYFNGWKQMCQNSNAHAFCQTPKYCNDGQLPCLPGWKHNGDLTIVEETGAAPDGDEDAILGMIIAVNAVKDDSNVPSWFSEVRTWADESCTQFLQDNSVLSSTGSHRLLKLGSCWGGFETNGSNPSYHSPGHYRAMRDFQESFEGRKYTLPSIGDNLSWTEKWNMLIDTSYKFLDTTQCPDTGLVPNWALVKEKNTMELEKYPGSFSGSGTPQYEFGAEASRTMWRIAVDALMYPDESEYAEQFLAPLHSKMVQHFDPNPSDNVSYFGDGTLKECSPIVSNVFGSWWLNGFIFGPVLSTLGTKITDNALESKSFSQQTMIDVACKKVNDIASDTSYYARSWQVLTSMTLNGNVQKAGELVRGYVGNSPTFTPTLNPTLTPTSLPSNLPTKSKTIVPTVSPACKSWCQGNSSPWSDKCMWVKCSLCEPCGTSSPTTVPTTAPTTLLTSVPTKLPTASPSASPTSSPVTGSTFCCSWNLYNCGVDGFCNLNEDNCQGSCGGAWVQKNSEAMECLAKWEDCTNKEYACCSGSSCQGSSNTYKQCVDILK